MIWEISHTGFNRNRQADWGKTVCPAFRRSAAGAGAFILEETTSRVNINDIPYQSIFRDKYSIPKKSSHPLTEARAGDLYFCLEHRLVTIREQPIELTIKEFEIFSLLLWVISLLTGSASWNKI